MADPLDIARAAWPGEWTRHASPGTHEALVLELPDPFTDQPGPRVVRADAEEEGGWWVSVRVGGELAEIIYDADLAEALRLARTIAVCELAPVLRALGADLITAALADTDEDLSVGYGAFPGGDPRAFAPDAEVCTPEELQAHADACRLANEREARGEPVTLPGSHYWMAKDGEMIVAHEPFGIGVYQIGGAGLDTDGEE